MAFLNVRFPTAISYGAVGGPGYSTDVVILGSGSESRNENWSQARRTYDVGMAVSSDAERMALITFFRVAKGKANSFRFKDFTDFEVGPSEGVFASLGSNAFQLYKRYTNAGGTEDVMITLPVAGTVAIPGYTVGGDAVLVTTTGIVTVSSGTPSSWTGQYDVPCRFDTDTLGLTAADLDIFRTQNIPIIEVRPEA